MAEGCALVRARLGAWLCVREAGRRALAAGPLGAAAAPAPAGAPPQAQVSVWCVCVRPRGRECVGVHPCCCGREPSLHLAAAAACPPPSAAASGAPTRRCLCCHRRRTAGSRYRGARCTACCAATACCPARRTRVSRAAPLAWLAGRVHCLHLASSSITNARNQILLAGWLGACLPPYVPNRVCPAGGGVAEARHLGLVTLVHRCRRFFPRGSAAEIWAQFGPALADPQRPECFEVGWAAGGASRGGWGWGWGCGWGWRCEG